MKYQEKLGYIVLGGFLMLVGMLASGLFSPLGAQSQGDGFGEITCTGLTVVNGDGNPVVKLSSTFAGGAVEVYDTIAHGDDDTPAVKLFAGFLGGGCTVNDIDSNWALSIGADAFGGIVNVVGEDGFARLNIAEHGGVFSLAGEGGTTLALISAYEHGGNVEVFR